MYKTPAEIAIEIDEALKEAEIRARRSAYIERLEARALADALKEWDLTRGVKN